MLNLLKKIYDGLPKEHLKFLRYIPDRVLFGKSYWGWQQKISFEKNNLDESLANTLLYVRQHTMYGKEKLPTNIHAGNAKEILETLPKISSQDLATNLAYYTSDEFNTFNSYLTTTGGSGRNPTTILLSNELFGIEWAHVHHIWSSVGYDRRKHLKLTLRGKSVKGDKLMEYNPVYNELVVDTFKVKRSNFPKLLQVLKRYDITYIHGYPSLVKEYIEYYREFGGMPNLRGVLLASEGISPEEKHIIAEFFGCRVVSFYGQTERALLAVDLKGAGEYRVYTSYGYPRVVDGELLITSFVNRALPLVNYAIGDGAVVREEKDHIYLLNLTSRWGKDFIFLDKDKKIPTAAINLHSMIQDEILFYQIHQYEFGEIEIRVLQKPGSRITAEELLKIFGKEMRKNLREFSVELRCVPDEEIIKSSRGKKMLLVQNLDQGILGASGH
ncbi:AMP-binding protein [Marinobacter sp.]|uniref:AMP-binding protein n=1 Tax=Marinobacter sp. TaxID=50741 RepID=UPI00384F2E4A